MSWHYSQALVAAYSAANSSDGAPSALLSGSPTQQAYLSPDRMKAFSRLSQFGMTFAPLTESLGEAVLTWCLEASPVKISAQLVKARELTEHAAECGRTWPESFTKWDLATSLWKTPPCLLAEDSTEFSGTWPRWGMMRAGECSVQSMPALRTSETEFGLWRTPMACDSKDMSCSSQIYLQDQVKMWPTLCANETGEKPENLMERMKKYGRTGSEVHMKLSTKVQMWPTPTAHNAKEQDCPAEATRHTPSLCHQARGGDKTQPRHLNPTWVEWLMGWPLGWTDLKPLVTDKFQSWRHSHGGF